MRKKQGKSIITQTVLRISAVFLAALMILTFAFTVFFWSYMKRNIVQSKREQVQSISQSINEDFDSITVPMISLGAYDSAIWLLKNPQDKYTQKWMRNIRSVNEYLENVTLFNNQVIDILLISADTQVVYSMSDNMRVTENYPAKQWFKEAIKKDGLIKTAYHKEANYFYRNKKVHTVSCIYPVYQRGILCGYVLFEYDLSKYVALFRENKGGMEGLLLIDTQGLRVFDYREEQVRSSERIELFRRLKTHGEEIWQTFDSMYIQMELPACGWTIVSETANSLLFEPIYRLIGVVVCIILLTILCLVGISFYNMKQMQKPFEMLLERIQTFDVRNQPEKTRMEHAPRELSIISHKFDEMSEHTRQLIHEVYVSEIAKKEMELEAMVNQINPHFLYNVFQLIQTEAVLAENQNIEEMIQALSNMMRYTMERKRDKVTIGEEIQYIQEYLMFYKERFPNLFTYEILCDEELKKYETIKFILQPVVENCFKHGLKNKRNGGIIRLEIFRVQEDILFKITDNGCGMKAERLQEMRNRLAGAECETGIGIINTNSRLRLVYGNSYGISFDSIENQYTEVTVRIKAECRSCV